MIYLDLATMIKSDILYLVFIFTFGDNTLNNSFTSSIH